jgi:hypothetical protein
MQYSCRENEDLQTQLLCDDGIEDGTLLTENTIFIYISFTNLDYHTKRVGVEITLYTLYSGYALFDPRLGQRLFELSIHVTQADARIALPLNHDRFLPNSLQLTTYLSFYLLMLYNLNIDSVVSPQNNKIKVIQFSYTGKRNTTK